MLDYEHPGLPPELIARFTGWQNLYWEAASWMEDDNFDYNAHHLAGVELAKELKKHVGEPVYVECDELTELLSAGTSADCRPRLGIPVRNTT